MKPEPQRAEAAEGPGGRAAGWPLLLPGAPSPAQGGGRGRRRPAWTRRPRGAVCMNPNAGQRGSRRLGGLASLRVPPGFNVRPEGDPGDPLTAHGALAAPHAGAVSEDRPGPSACLESGWAHLSAGVTMQGGPWGLRARRTSRTSFPKVGWLSRASGVRVAPGGSSPVLSHFQRRRRT